MYNTLLFNSSLPFSILDRASSAIFRLLRGNPGSARPSDSQLSTLLVCQATGRCFSDEIFTAAGTGRGLKSATALNDLNELNVCVVALWSMVSYRIKKR